MSIVSESLQRPKYWFVKPVKDILLFLAERGAWVDLDMFELDRVYKTKGSHQSGATSRMYTSMIRDGGLLLSRSIWNWPLELLEEREV